tara:strand:+ start:3137 stop:3577 length:441 start_codon:yes stop_codon:yes gene_type:complete
MAARHTSIVAMKEAHDRPERMNEVSFEAFMVAATDSAKDISVIRGTYAIGEIEAETAEEAVNQAIGSRSFSHKDKLAIRQIMPRSRFGREQRLLHVYAIKKRSRPGYVRDPQTGKPMREPPLYPEFVCTIDERVLAGEAEKTGMLT